MGQPSRICSGWVRRCNVCHPCWRCSGGDDDSLFAASSRNSKNATFEANVATQSSNWQAKVQRRVLFRAGDHTNRRKPRSISSSTQCRGSHQRKLEVIRQLADSNQVDVVLLHETHRATDDNLKLPGFFLAVSIPSKYHGMATFVRTGITWSAVKRSPSDSNTEWLVTEVQ